MSGNDIMEMDSASETEGTDRDIELVMINEEVGKKTAFVCLKEMLSRCACLGRYVDSLELIPVY